jgi:glutathione S-transferase
MKIHLFPLSGRIVGIVALKNYLALDCELKPVDLAEGDQRAPEYVSLNPNRKVPTLEDDRIVLWESNAILFYMASKRPESGVWPSDLGPGRCSALAFLGECALGLRVVRPGRIREGFEGCAWPRLHPTRPSLREVSDTSTASLRYSTTY